MIEDRGKEDRERGLEIGIMRLGFGYKGLRKENKRGRETDEQKSIILEHQMTWDRETLARGSE